MGVFNAAQRVKIVPEMILGMLLAPLLPILSERFGLQDIRGYTKVAQSAFVLALIVTAPFALIQLAVPSLTLLPYGADYAGHQGVVQWLMLDLAVIGLFIPVGEIVTSMGRMWFGFFYSLGFAILFLALSLAFIPRTGAVGLAAAGTVAHLLCLGPSLYYIYKKERAFVAGLPVVHVSWQLCLVAVGICIMQRCCPPILAGTASALVTGFLILRHLKTLSTHTELFWAHRP
jgi:O-antigen/teichoic acid export membrane protein